MASARQHGSDQRPRAELCEGAVGLAPEEFFEVDGLIEAQLVGDGRNRQVPVHRQAPSFHGDPRRGERLGNGAAAGRGGARQAFFGAAKLLCVAGHLVPLREALLHQLLEAPKTLHRWWTKRLLRGAWVLQESEPRQQRMKLVKQQRLDHS